MRHEGTRFNGTCRAHRVHDTVDEKEQATSDEGEQTHGLEYGSPDPRMRLYSRRPPD